MTPTELYNKFKELKESGRLPEFIRNFNYSVVTDIFHFFVNDSKYSTNWERIEIVNDRIEAINITSGNRCLSVDLKEPIKTMKTIKFAYTKELKEHSDNLHLALHGKKCKSHIDDQYYWDIRVGDNKLIYNCPQLNNRYYVYNSGEVSLEGNKIYINGVLNMTLIDEEQEKALERIKVIEKELKELKEFVGKK